MKRFILFFFLFNGCIVPFCNAQADLNLSSILENLTLQPVDFRTFAITELGFKFTDTKNCEDGVMARDEFCKNGITLKKDYGLLTIIAANGEGLDSIPYLYDDDLLHEKKLNWTDDDESNASSLTLENVNDSLAQSLKEQAIKLGAIENHTYLAQTIPGGDFKKYTINDTYDLDFTSHDTAKGVIYQIEISPDY